MWEEGRLKPRPFVLRVYAAATPVARAKVASARGILLEELERCEPEPMAEWLEAGAVEPEGPPAYLVRR